MTLYALAALYGGCVLGIVFCVFTAPEGVETPQGFRQLDRSEAPDDPADLHGAGGGEIFTHHGPTISGAE